MYYTVLNLVEPGRNLVSVPQLYGTTHTLFAHILPRFGIKVKFGRTDSPQELESLIDGNTRALFCETVGNPAGNICDLEALAAIAQRARVPLVVDNTVPTPISAAADRVRGRYRGALAHEISRRTRHDTRRCDCRQRPLPLGAAR
jgi:O-acetylhomoserine/O-acetylserine sulfhydrylase-like pyridoxal-dependent enzyme